MPSPALSLALGLAVVFAAVALFWPDRGLLWSSLRASRAKERVHTEDALKHLFDCEYHGNLCTLKSVAGALRVSQHKAAEIVDRMQQADLARATEGGFGLTPEGRAYALKVIRIHRLWERYLSDETSLEPDKWHDEAEHLEHRTTAQEAEALSARMGHPRYDPHGDPIPTAAGEIAPPQGKALTELEVDTLAEIVHVEDEPAAVYAQLVAAGLHPGMKVRISEKTPQRIRFEANAEEHVLAPILAANLSVVPLPVEATMEGPQDRLSSLDIGEHATMTGFSPWCRGNERRRMLDLGLIPGTVVSAEIRSPAGDPTGYRIRGAVIALRRSQADLIQVERGSKEAAA